MKIKKLLFLPVWAICILVPVSGVILISAMLLLEKSSLIRIFAYVFAFYALCVFCVRIPDIITLIKNFIKENKYTQLWLGDIRLRMEITLALSFIWNCAYAVLQLGLGLHYKQIWFFSLSGYYFLMSVMRFFLARHTFLFKPNENQKKELILYKICGWTFLLMNISVFVTVFYTVSGYRTVDHSEITAIAMATYTFTAFTVAIVNILRYRKFNSPVYSASKAISLASACVSVMTLESTMLSTFSSGKLTLQSQKTIMITTGVAIAVFIIAMAVYMIVKATRKINITENENET